MFSRGSRSWIGRSPPSPVWCGLRSIRVPEIPSDTGERPRIVRRIRSRSNRPAFSRVLRPIDEIVG